jgi:hypothetical protein
VSREGVPEAPWRAPHAVRGRTSRLKRIAGWFYDHASNVGVLTGIVAVVGSVYLLLTGGAGLNILVVVPGVALIGLFFFAAGALLSALLGALFDLAAYTARRINKAVTRRDAVR